MGMMMVSPRSDGVGAGGRPRPCRPEGLMPDLKSLNTICYMICIVCIVAGTLLGLGMIWVSSENPYIWKGLLTIFVLFAAAALTLSVNRAVAGRGDGPGKPQPWTD